MINSINYATIKSVGAVVSLILGAARTSMQKMVRSCAITNAPEVHTAIPFLVPQLWWLVLKTVQLKWKRHRCINPAGYVDYLNRPCKGKPT